MKDEIENIKFKLNEIDHNYRKLFNKHDKAMLLIDPSTGKIIEANEAAVKYYGYSIDELLNMKIQDINVLDEKQVKEEMKLAKGGEKKETTFNLLIVYPIISLEMWKCIVTL